MTRGNQREKAREKNQKKLAQIAKQKKGGEKGENQATALTARKERDADVMRQKQAAAAAKKASEASGGAAK